MAKLNKLDQIWEPKLDLKRKKYNFFSCKLKPIFIKNVIIYIKIE